MWARVARETPLVSHQCRLLRWYSESLSHEELLPRNDLTAEPVSIPDVLLPKCRFSSRNSVAEEMQYYSSFQDSFVYRPQLLQKQAGDKTLHDSMGRIRKPFVLLDGPPFANGALHMGHFLNKLLKDMYLRYKMQLGFSVRYGYLTTLPSFV